MKTKEQLFDRLNKSIYRKNLEEVWQVLEKYPKNCQKIFLKNLKTLTFKQISIEELQELSKDLDVEGMYIPNENTIYLNEFKNERVEINHELFHVSSCTPKRLGVIVYVTIDDVTKAIGENLNEGITQYLAELSTKTNNQKDSAYQLNVFVIESLINIYGKNILNPYFQNNPVKFYSQFKSNTYKIIKLDILLNKINKRINLKNLFEEYLLLKDLSKNKLKDNNLYIEITNLKELNKYIKKREFEINKLYKDIEKEEIKGNDIYVLKKEENKEIYLNWYKEYTKIQSSSFEKIIKTIITLARNSNISDKEILEMLTKNLQYKKEILEEIEYKNKKLIRK